MLAGIEPRTFLSRGYHTNNVANTMALAADPMPATFFQALARPLLERRQRELADRRFPDVAGEGKHRPEVDRLQLLQPEVQPARKGQF